MKEIIPHKPFYLLRHGETVANAARICAGGFYDTPLNDNGKMVAEELSAVITQSDFKAGKIFHSPLSRAKDTASIINRSLNLEMEQIDNLREHIIGVWEGTPWEETLPLLNSNVKPEGGENSTEYAQRLVPVFTDILNRKSDLPPLIVSHGGTFKMLGIMYDYEIEGSKNCHLHYFEPDETQTLFPWRVYSYEVENDNITKITAEICPSIRNLGKEACAFGV